MNEVSIDINHVVTDSYYRHLLLFVRSLPCKASMLVKIAGLVSHINNLVSDLIYLLRVEIS